MEITDRLAQKGVRISTPASVDIGPDVDPERISGEGVVVHSGCKIFGPRTLIGPGVDMAPDLIRLSGFEPDADIKIEFIGLRPGEKLYEELITADENARPTFHPKILMLKGSACDLDLLNGKIHELESLTQTQDALRIRLKLQEIVPDYTPSAPADSYEPAVRGIASAAVVEPSRPGNSIRKGHVRI